jgi:hypothetical protein
MPEPFPPHGAAIAVVQCPTGDRCARLEDSRGRVKKAERDPDTVEH